MLNKAVFIYQKYSKNSNIVKWYYNLKWMFFTYTFNIFLIPDGKSEF